MDYFLLYEPQSTAGAAISSEQSGEMLHSRMQNLWELRFKTNAEHELYPQRLVDCMVTYNYNYGRMMQKGYLKNRGIYSLMHVEPVMKRRVMTILKG